MKGGKGEHTRKQTREHRRLKMEQREGKGKEREKKKIVLCRIRGKKVDVRYIHRKKENAMD